MTTKAELQKRVEELEAQLSEDGRPPEMAVITLSYDKQGTLSAVAASHIGTAAQLQATKVALAQVGQQIDMMLLGAVEREARESAIAPSPE